MVVGITKADDVDRTFSVAGSNIQENGGIQAHALVKHKKKGVWLTKSFS